MSITYCEETKSFHLDTEKTSYVFGVYGEGRLIHYYHGARIPVEDAREMAVLADWCSSNDPVDEFVPEKGFSPNIAMQEYSASGEGDLRPAALSVRYEAGHGVTHLRYRGHRITEGLPEIAGLPHLFAENTAAETLEIDLADEAMGLLVTLRYSLIKGLPVILRNARIVNEGKAPMEIGNAASASFALPETDYDAVHLPGYYAHERTAVREALPTGTFTVSSSRGQSGHWANPFLALAEKSATEERGSVYAFSYVYSGSFAISVNKNPRGTLRVNVGMDPATFGWHLDAGESLELPQTVALYTDGGLGEMSRIFHRLFRRHLIRGEWREKKRPLLINSWEAAFFDFTGDKLVAFAKEAKKLGVEMLVMDDGWFSRRSDDTSSLGDWWVNEEKLGGTLSELSRRIHAEGLKFGIWFEPEMVSPDSDLYRAHPDWCLHAEGVRSDCRKQYILDLSREEARDNIFEQMTAVLDAAEIDYVKWDFNRPLTEIYSKNLPAHRQKEAYHRFMLGSYDLWERITQRYPGTLFESCASGGGRFDAGMLYYAPQVWTSDNTDPVDRIVIQHGTSLVYPTSSMGSHVSAHPRTGIGFKGNVALSGSFGYEMDPLKLTEEEKEIVKRQVEEYHRSYFLTHNGDLYRLHTPLDSCDRIVWSYVAEDKSEALVLCATLAKPASPKFILRLAGLCEDALYEIEETGARHSGAYLMRAGINLTKAMTPWRASHESFLLHVRRVSR